MPYCDHWFAGLRRLAYGSMVILSSEASPACGCPGLVCRPSPRRHDEYVTGHRHLRPARASPVDDTRRNIVAHKLRWNTCSIVDRHAADEPNGRRSQERQPAQRPALADRRDGSSAHPRAQFPRTVSPIPRPDSLPRPARHARSLPARRDTGRKHTSGRGPTEGRLDRLVKLRVLHASGNQRDGHDLIGTASGTTAPSMIAMRSETSRRTNHSGTRRADVMASSSSEDASFWPRSTSDR